MARQSEAMGICRGCNGRRRTWHGIEEGIVQPIVPCFACKGTGKKPEGEQLCDLIDCQEVATDIRLVQGYLVKVPENMGNSDLLQYASVVANVCPQHIEKGLEVH